MSVNIEITGQDNMEAVPEIKTGDKFCCEGIMYEIVRGGMCYSNWGCKKSNNFQVRQLKWKENVTTIESINNTKNIINKTFYKLEGSGEPHKFVPFKKYSYVVYPFKDAQLSIYWKSKERREKYLSDIDMDEHFLN